MIPMYTPPMTWPNLHTVDSSLGRLDFSLMSDQARMELLVEGLDANFLEVQQDDNGEFLDVCEWDGVHCDESETVTSVSLSGAYSGLARLDFLPAKVQKFHFGSFVIRGQISGTLDVAGFPATLQDFDISQNVFYGTIDLPKLPRGFLYFSIETNGFAGSCDLCGLPPNLEAIDLSSNKFTGSVCLTALPDTLYDVLLHRNFFEGQVRLEKLPRELRRLTLQENNFQGEFHWLDANIGAYAGVKIRATDCRLTGTARVTRTKNLKLRLDRNSVKAVKDENGRKHPLEKEIMENWKPYW